MLLRFNRLLSLRSLRCLSNLFISSFHLCIHWLALSISVKLFVCLLFKCLELWLHIGENVHWFYSLGWLKCKGNLSGCYKGKETTFSICKCNGCWNTTRAVEDDCRPVEPVPLLECLPNSMRQSSSPGHQESSGKGHLSNSNAEQNGAENAVYTSPTLIPPRIRPLPHDLAQ